MPNKSKDKNLSISIKYSTDVLGGVIPACIYVKQAAQRFLNDLDSTTYKYETQEVNRVITFINSLYLTEQKKPKHFILEPWQTFLISNIYGIINRETGLRKYRSAYIEMARKNGKSQIISALAIYHTLFDNDGQIVVSANSLQQARNVNFKKLKQFAKMIDPQQKYLIPYYNSIKFGGNEIIITASDPKTLDGLNASFCLIDELHEAKSNQMYNVMKSSQGGREEPIFISITTAGFDTSSFCYSLRTYCSEILSGLKKDDSQFAIIYTIDPDDDINDKEIWVKANPNLNVSVYSAFLESEVTKAENSETERAGVLVKNFNQWLRANSNDIWIADAYVDAVMKPIKVTDEAYKGLECIVGIDLSSVSDITAVSYMFPIGEEYHFFNRYYLPEDSINSNQNREMIREAAAHGYIKITDGNVVDYDIILADLLEFNEHNEITSIYYDKYNSTQFAINATEAGFYMQQFSQLAGSLNRPLKEFERLIKSDQIVIEANTLTKWMFGNVILKINIMGNYSLDKSSKQKKIDGVASIIDALGGYLESPAYGFNVY